MRYRSGNIMIASVAKLRGVICIMGSAGTDPVTISLTNYIISYGSMGISPTLKGSIGKLKVQVTFC